NACLIWSGRSLSSMSLLAFPLLPAAESVLPAGDRSTWMPEDGSPPATSLPFPEEEIVPALPAGDGIAPDSRPGDIAGFLSRLIMGRPLYLYRSSASIT